MNEKKKLPVKIRFMDEEDAETLRLFRENTNTFDELVTTLFFALRSVNKRLSELEEDE